MADNPVACPKCGGTVFVVGQLAFERQDFDSATGDWSASYDRSYDEDYPQEAKCKDCGEDVTDLLNEGTIQFYGAPPEREPVFDDDDGDDEGCPKDDPDCTSRADECHDACERPAEFQAEIDALRKAVRS